MPNSSLRDDGRLNWPFARVFPVLRRSEEILLVLVGKGPILNHRTRGAHEY